MSGALHVFEVDWRGRSTLSWGPVVTGGLTYGLAVGLSSASSGDTSTAAIGEGIAAVIGGAIGLMAGTAAVTRVTRGDILPWLARVWAAVAGVGSVAAIAALRPGGATASDVLAFGGVMFVPALLVVWSGAVMRPRPKGVVEQ